MPLDVCPSLIFSFGAFGPVQRVGPCQNQPSPPLLLHFPRADMGSPQASSPGRCGECLCADPAEVHIPQPPGAGGPGSAAEHLPDQPDAQRPQPCGLRQRAGDFSQAPRPPEVGMGTHWLSSHPLEKCRNPPNLAHSKLGTSPRPTFVLHGNGWG